MKTILLRSSWQTKNIGDIAHTPGFLNLAKRYLPDNPIWLWPCQINRGVREMLLENFPGLRIVESDAEIQEAFEKCSLMINGSGPGIEKWSLQEWRARTKKPYGFYGISTDGLWKNLLLTFRALAPRVVVHWEHWKHVASVVGAYTAA